MSWKTLAKGIFDGLGNYAINGVNVMFYLSELPDNPPGFNAISNPAEWEGWLIDALPREADVEIKRRLSSNLKHILVGLEMKAGLIIPHCTRVAAAPSILFESYCQTMIFEFCVGVYSVCEGLGSIHYLTSQGDDGAGGGAVYRQNWQDALVLVFDDTGEHDLREAVGIVECVFRVILPPIPTTFCH